MKQSKNNHFKNLSKLSSWSAALPVEAKLQLIGSSLLILSLFLNWYSDVDVFRSGNSFTGLTGPLYFAGLNLLILAVANLVITIGKSFKWQMLKALNNINLGKLQLSFGFGAMYLLIIVNSVYFHPQYGLNVLSKKSEIGVMVALVATVLICIGGYLAFRKKLVETHPNDKLIMEPQAEKIVTEVIQPVDKFHVETVNSPADIKEKPSQVYVGGIREKTDYERNRAYESLKKMMLKDTLTPEQRRKEREKTVKENAFSANFGKNGEVNGSSELVKKNMDSTSRLQQEKFKKTTTVNNSEISKSEKKPQMYRLDL